MPDEKRFVGRMATSLRQAAVCTQLRRLGQGQMQLGRSHLSKRTCAGGAAACRSAGACPVLPTNERSPQRLGSSSAADGRQCSDCSRAPRAKLRRRLPVWPPPERVDHVNTLDVQCLPGTAPDARRCSKCSAIPGNLHSQMLYHDVCTAMPYQTGTGSRRCREFDS